MAKTNVESWQIQVNKLCFSRYKLPVTLYRRVRCAYINFAFKMLFHRKQTLFFQYTDPFYAGGQLEKCGGQLTYDDYNGKYALSGNHENVPDS